MDIKIFRQGKPEDFSDWTDVPKTAEQRETWQGLSKSWWEKNPNRYDFSHGSIPYPEFSKEFYQEIDRRFFESVWQFMPWKKIPFDNLIGFDSLKQKDVLEIGVGCGSHAQLLAQHSRSFCGIDITEYGIKSTTERLRHFGLKGNITRMDAEKMEFADNSFDFIWSWGVIHHSSNTANVLDEMHRVLRPGGRAVTMVYHRSVWNTYVRGALYYGIVRGWYLRTRSLSAIIQRATDGALARYYTVPEWKNLLSKRFAVEQVFVYGSKSQIIPLPMGKAKLFFMSLVPNAAGRLITNRPAMGFLLVSAFHKKPA